MKKIFASLWADILKIKSTKKELREFGFVVGGVFALLGAFLWWKHKHYEFFTITGTALIVLGALLPTALKPFQKIWMAFAVIMGSIMTRVLMFLLFFLALTPIRFVAFIARRSFLDLRFKTGDTTYWIDRSADNTPKERYEKQF